MLPVLPIDIENKIFLYMSCKRFEPKYYDGYLNYLESEE